MEKIDLKTAVDVFLREIPSDTEHLSLESIYRLSLENGLKNAPEEELGHLWQCPSCLEKWETFSIAWDNDSNSLETDDLCLSFGMLKAAATDSSEPLHLTSSCHRFVLGVHPDSKHPKKGMVTVDIVGDLPSMEKMRVCVRDATHEKVLESVIVGGRAAVKIEDLDKLDLSAWTISFFEDQKTDTNE